MVSTWFTMAVAPSAAEAVAWRNELFVHILRLSGTEIFFIAIRSNFENNISFKTCSFLQT